MTSNRNPEELRELLAAYALDAVEPEDREPIEQLLANDSAAAGELEGYERATTLLDSDGPDPLVWSRIEAALDDDAAAASVASIAARARRRHRNARIGLVLAAAAVLAAVFIFGQHALTGRSLPTKPASNTRHQEELAARSPRARHLTLVSSDGRSHVDVLLGPNGRDYILGGTLTPHRGKILALFATTNGHPKLVKVIGSTVRLIAFQLPPFADGLVVGETSGLGKPVTALASATLAAACGPTCPPSQPAAPTAPVAPTPTPTQSPNPTPNPTSPPNTSPLTGPAQPGTTPTNPSQGSPAPGGGGGLPPLPLPPLPLPPLPILPGLSVSAPLLNLSIGT